MQNNKRITEYDIARGIGILLVVIGHEFTKGHISSFIYSFHMPLFFVLSGLVTIIPNDLRKASLFEQ